MHELLTHFVELRKTGDVQSVTQAGQLNPLRTGEGTATTTADSEEPLRSASSTPAGVPRLRDHWRRTPGIAGTDDAAALFDRIVVEALATRGGPDRQRAGHPGPLRAVFKGVASNHLAGVAPAQIRARVDPARQAFRAGAEPANVIPGQCEGTRRAVLRLPGDRLAAKDAGAPFAPALCFFGVRDPDVDYIFRDLFAEGERLGIVRECGPAFSAPRRTASATGSDCRRRRRVWALLGDPRTPTCSSAVTAREWHRGPAGVPWYLPGPDRCDDDAAKVWLEALVASDHYVEDVWAG